MTITALPTAPSRADPTNFPTRADAWITQFTNTTVGEVNTTQAAINASEANATNQATTALAQATAAAASAAAALASALQSAASAGAALWVSGTTYAAQAVVVSPADQRLYRRFSGGGGTTDPSADGANWTLIVLATDSVAALSILTFLRF